MEFSRAVTEAFCSRMTNKCSVLRNNIPVDAVKLSIMQLTRRHTDKSFNKAVFILGRAIASLALIFSLGRENRQALGPYRRKRKIGDTQRPETSCAVQTCKTAYQ